MTATTTATTTETTTGDAPDVAQTTGSYTITNVRAVLADRVLDCATVVVHDGSIAAVEEGSRPLDADQVIDGRGSLLMPGLVDTHSDGLEKEINPRRTAVFPAQYAIPAFEGRLRSSGVTTAFHGVGYQDKPRTGRSVERARHLTNEIHARSASGDAAVDHRILFRFEARDATALEPMLDDLAHGSLGSMPLISFEDHTPGQGQYRDVSTFAAAIHPEDVPDGLTVDEYVAQIVAEGEAHLAAREANIARLAPHAISGHIRLLAHDAEHADDIAAAFEVGASIAEFPLTIEAAQAARDRDMAIVMGAPNALRGSSHAGNASARDLVASGLCDVLASDYLPPAMLAAVFAMVREGVCSLAQGVALVTSGPARLAGLDDRGELAVGRRADLILVDDSGDWPIVVGSRRATDPVVRRVFG